LLIRRRQMTCRITCRLKSKLWSLCWVTAAGSTIVSLDPSPINSSLHFSHVGYLQARNQDSERRKGYFGRCGYWLICRVPLCHSERHWNNTQRQVEAHCRCQGFAEDIEIGWEGAAPERFWSSAKRTIPYWGGSWYGCLPFKLQSMIPRRPHCLSSLWVTLLSQICSGFRKTLSLLLTKALFRTALCEEFASSPGAWFQLSLHSLSRLQTSPGIRFLSSVSVELDSFQFS